MSSNTAHSYEFENFRLDLSEKVLFCDDKPVSITPKTFETLQVFVENAGRLLEKDELMQRIWQDRFVEESNLAFNIKILRRVLNDDAHHPRFIETVPRRGYRFIATVKETTGKEKFGDTASEAAVAQSTPVTFRRRSNRSYLWLGSFLTLLLVSGVAVLLLMRSRSSASTPSASILSTPFKSKNFSNTGSVRAVITPDGKYVAYTTDNGGKQSLWLRQLETAENILIVPPSGDQYLGLAISHDGNSLYYVKKESANRSSLYRVMTFGGIPTKIVDLAEGWISVSPDDTKISFVRCRYSQDDFCSLFIADADGKKEENILTRPRPIRISDNQFSPDGKSIAFADGESLNGGSDFHLSLFDLVRRSEHQISAKTFFEIKSLKWLPDGANILLTASEMMDGPMKIWQASTTTQEVNALTNDATNYGSISLNAVGNKMIATNLSNTFHLYVTHKADFNNAKSLAAARTFTFGPGEKIVYAGDDGDIWVINQQGGEQRQLTSGPFKEFSPRVSADGRYIFFGSARSGSIRVWRMDADGSGQMQLTNREGGSPKFVTPDGEWVYFESGLHQTLWRIPTAGGEETQISDVRVSQSAFSPDGKLVAYFFRPKDDDSHRGIAVMSLESRKVLKTFPLSDEKIQPIGIAWQADNMSFYFVTSVGTNSLWTASIKDAAPQFIADLGSEEINDFAFSTDGNNLGFVRGRWILGAVLIEGLK